MTDDKKEPGPELGESESPKQEDSGTLLFNLRNKEKR